MKISRLFFVSIAALFIIFSCSAQSGKPDKNQPNVSTEPVEVFYFHFTRRCVTCQAVESQSRQIISELYGDKVSFTAYNLDEDEGAVKGKELGVNGQTLLIIKGDTKVNLTNEGFMYARSDPEKFRQVLKEKIDTIL